MGNLIKRLQVCVLSLANLFFALFVFTMFVLKIIQVEKLD